MPRTRKRRNAKVSSASDEEAAPRTRRRSTRSSSAAAAAAAASTQDSDGEFTQDDSQSQSQSQSPSQSQSQSQSQTQTQRPAGSQSSGDGDEAELELWNPEQGIGPMDPSVRQLKLWKLPKTSTKTSSTTKLATDVFEAGVKYATKKLLATGMQQFNRKPVDLYGAISREIKALLLDEYKMGTKGKGQYRSIRREDLNMMYQEAARRLNVFYGFSVVCYTPGDNSRVIVVSALEFQEYDSMEFRRTLYSGITEGSAVDNRQAVLGFYMAVLGCVTLENVERHRLWEQLHNQKWFPDPKTKVHPQLGKLEVLLQQMLAENYIRSVESNIDGAGNAVELLALGQRAILEIGMDGLVDFVEQLYVSNNEMHDSHRRMWRAELKRQIEDGMKSS